VQILAFRRSTDPPPPEGEYPLIFIDQFGDVVSIWLGQLHIQIYRAWVLPMIRFERWDSEAQDWRD
jgi:hypothetical protein